MEKSKIEELYNSNKIMLPPPFPDLTNYFISL